MKKFITMAAAVLVTLAASAQNPDGLKQVLAAKSYSEANEMVKTLAESMTNEEKAKAYNKLVDLALADNDKAEKKALEAQLAKNDEEMNKQNEKKAKAAYNALKMARECQKADMEPNAKGKVSPKFQSKNAGRLMIVRNQLIQAGLDAYNAKKYADAQKYFGQYVEARQDPLFAKADFSQEKGYGQIAYYAALAAYFNKDSKKCSKYADIALNSGEAEIVSDALTVKLGALEEQAKEGSIDTVKYIKEVKKVYDVHKDNETVFGKLVGLLDESGDKDGAKKLLNSRLAENPNDAMANAYVGQGAQSEENYDVAIDAYKKALVAKPDFIHVKMNLGVCYLNKAAKQIDANTDARGNIKPDAKAAILADLNTAKTILEEVKAADPDRLQVNWSYPLERVNYAIENIQ